MRHSTVREVMMMGVGLSATEDDQVLDVNQSIAVINCTNATAVQANASIATEAVLSDHM